MVALPPPRIIVPDFAPIGERLRLPRWARPWERTLDDAAVAATSVRASSSATSASATSVAPAAPTGTTTGDLVIVVVSSNNAVTLSDNNGTTPFTKDSTTQEAEEGQTVSIFSRRILAGDPSSYSFSSSGAATRLTAVAVTFQSPHPSTIYDAVPVGNPQTGAGGSTTITALSVTTVTPNAINCAVFCPDGASNTVSGLPAGYTVEQNTGDERIAFTWKVIAAAGATGNLTATQAASDGWIGYQFAIANRPAASLVADSRRVQRNSLLRRHHQPRDRVAVYMNALRPDWRPRPTGILVHA